MGSSKLTKRIGVSPDSILITATHENNKKSPTGSQQPELRVT